jgi:hypothetical protein
MLVEAVALNAAVVMVHSVTPPKTRAIVIVGVVVPGVV